MDEVPYGIIEIGLAFGSLLAWAVWETVRTRRDLARLKAKRDMKGHAPRRSNS